MLESGLVIQKRCRGKKRVCCANYDCKQFKKALQKLRLRTKEEIIIGELQQAGKPIQMDQHQNDVIEASDDVN